MVKCGISSAYKDTFSKNRNSSSNFISQVLLKCERAERNAAT